MMSETMQHSQDCPVCGDSCENQSVESRVWLYDYLVIVDGYEDTVHESLEMSAEEFWELIEAARQVHCGDYGKQVESLTQMLSELTVGEIFAFTDILYDKVDVLDTHGIRAVAAAIHDDASDGGLDYFRAWIVAQGKATFAKAWLEPESLISQYENYDPFETIIDAAIEAYALKAGTDIVTATESWAVEWERRESEGPRF